MPILAAGGIWLLEVTGVRAEEVPSVGLLYNTKETHSMVYRCQQNRDNSLDCEFTQTAVRKKAKPEDLNSKLNQARKEFRGGAKNSAEECKMFNELVDVLEGRKKPPKEEGFKEITDMQKKDLLKTSRGMVEFCKSRTEENFLNMVRLVHEKETRTCQVSSNAFKQSFRYVQDTLSDTGAWVVQGTPEGPCGIVQLSRFEPDRLKDSKLIFWKYVARKAVTNPQGSFFPGASCKGFDEGEYVYDWKSKEHSLGCDYVEFSPL
jgi:hypothetical protein